MQLIYFKKELFNKIINFNQKSFSLRVGVEESFQHRFFQNPYSNTIEKCAFIQNMDDGEILGQFLIMGNQFHFQGKSFEGVWGFDFIVDEKLRGQKKGKVLAESAISTSNYCVFGVSKASEALHFKFGNKELANAQRFIRPVGISGAFNFLFFNKKFDRKDVQYSQYVFFDKTRVSRITNLENLPDIPFWNTENLEWDRSKRFLKWRFFSEKNKYALYLAEDESFYFVVRKIRWRNLNCLLLVDYRYSNEKSFETIYKMALKVASQTKCIVLITVSSMENEQKVLKKNFNTTFSEPISIMTTNTEVFPAKKVAITAADSDFDTFYGDNIW